jgi:phosphoribosylaminoimidazolecarboxamide formyltransferase/IMP cyclohydrolase
MQVAHALFAARNPGKVLDLARFLSEKVGAKLLATADTARFLTARGIPVVETSGLCSVGSGADPAVRAPSGEVLDLVVVNLPDPPRREPREGFDLLAFEMDVLGPTLVRDAVSRLETTCVVVDVEDYEAVVQELTYKGELDVPFCRRCARRSIARVAAYEGPLTRELTSFDEEGFRQPVPEIVIAGYRRLNELAAGSNDHQRAWLYRSDDAVAGTLPMTLNYGPTGPLDVTRALDVALATQLLAEHLAPTAALIVRQKPVAVASAGKIEDAVTFLAGCLSPALSSAVVAVNAPASAEVIRTLARAPMAAFVAPSVDPDAVEELAARKGLSVLATGGNVPADARDLSIFVVPGALLVEERDARCKGEIEGADPGARRPTEVERDALVFAWGVVKYARSDAIVLVRQDGSVMHTVGVAAGEISRRLAIERALREAGPDAEGAVLASDGRITEGADLERIANAGVSAVAHPGGPEDGARFTVRATGRDLAIVATNVAHVRY